MNAWLNMAAIFFYAVGIVACVLALRSIIDELYLRTFLLFALSFFSVRNGRNIFSYLEYRREKS